MRSLLIICLLLSGCSILPHAKPTAKPNATSDISSPIALGDKKVDDLLKAERERMAKAKADIEHAVQANSANADPGLKAIIDGDLGVALAWLSAIPSDLNEFNARDEQQALVNTGKIEQAIQDYFTAREHASKRAADIAALQAEMERLRVERDAKIAELERTLEANRIANEKAMQKALDEERRKQQRKLTWILSLGTIGLLAVGAFLAYTKFNAGEPIKALIAGGFWAGAAAVCGVFAWAINQEWFQNLVMWLMVGTGVLGLTAGTIYVVAELRSAKEKRVRTGEADEAEDTLKRIINTVDSLPEDTKLSDLIARLSSSMDKPHKALIHELRAEQKRAA